MSLQVFKRNQPNLFNFRRKLTVFAVAAAAALSFAAAPASANSKYAGIVVDAKTGKTLYSNSADERRYPASLTKMMTLYLVFEALESGQINLDTRIPFSAKAAAEPPTKLGVKAGQSITVKTGILSLVTKSANDASTAIAEFLGGSEAVFARMMTAKARALGMSNTVFKNAHGLPDSSQYTTARDMARLGIALREHFPQYYDYFSTRSFTYRGVRMGNHNRLLGRVKGVDGIKTGYTRASGFNLVSSVRARDRSIVAVVLGGRTGASRNAQMEKLIAKYLPKASTRGNGLNIPKPSGIVTIAGLDLPDVGPIPNFRGSPANRIELAYATTASKPVQGRAALAAQLARQKVAVPQPAPAFAPPAPIAAAAVATAAIDPVTTASTMAKNSVPAGWQIQIGAMPDHKAALAMLDRAQSIGGNALSGTTPYTMAYEKGSEQLYRARFAGFDGQDAAVAACAALKRKGFGCWATPN